MGKVLPLSDAIARHVPDEALVFVGGFGHCVPFAAGHEIVRQRKRNLTLCRSGADILFDQLIAAGCVARVIFGYLGNPGVGLAHAFRRAVAAGTLEVEEWTNFTLILRLHAGRLGLPFLPTRTLLAGDVAGASADARRVTCPFTGSELAAVPALHPDVALIHAQRADEDGNVQMWGIDGDTREGALASRVVLATVEEIVPRAILRATPERTIVPAARVAAVSLAPGGAHPSYVQDYYGRDDAHFSYFDEVARKPEDLDAYLERFVYAVTSRGEYLERLDVALRRDLGLATTEPVA